jgi:hypothetical protein
MPRLTVVALAAALLCTSGYLSAQGKVRQHGRAIVEYRSPDVRAVAAYEYSQRNHTGAWLLIEFAVQATRRIAIHRDQISVIGPDERRVPVASQQQFLDDHQELTKLLQNAVIWRRPLDSYFARRPEPTIRFFSPAGKSIVHDSAATNLDEVAAGDLFFKSPDGRWPAGTYRLILNHDQAKAELPIRLE